MAEAGFRHRQSNSRARAFVSPEYTKRPLKLIKKKKDKQPGRKWGKDMNRQFTKRKMQMAKKYMVFLSIILVKCFWLVKSGDGTGLGEKHTLVTASVGVHNGTCIFETICQNLLKYKIHIPFGLIVSLYLDTKEIDKNVHWSPICNCAKQKQTTCLPVRSGITGHGQSHATGMPAPWSIRLWMRYRYKNIDI